MWIGIVTVYFIFAFFFMIAFGIIDHQNREEDRFPTFREFVDYFITSLIWPVLVAMAVIQKL